MESWITELFECYQTVFSDTPGLTRLAEHMQDPHDGQ